MQEPGLHICEWPSKDKDDEYRNIKVGDKVCVRPGRFAVRGVVLKVNPNPGDYMVTYDVSVMGGLDLTVQWDDIGTYPHKVSPTAVDVVTRDTLPPDVIRKIKTYGGKKSRKVRKSRKSRKSRTRKQ